MTGEAKPSVEASAPPAADDTVEFELTAEQQLELWQAAGALARPAEGQTAPPVYDAYICRRNDRVDRVCTAAFATLVLGLTVATGWRAIGEPPPAPAIVVKTATAPTLAAAERPRPPAVQVLNPFDPTEVFEMPPNTTESDARSAIAELLLQRARERLRQGFNVHRAANRRSHVAASSPAEVFVTRLSGPEDQFGGIAGLNTERAAAD